MLYIGPETIMPVASVLAGIAGFLMLIWRRLVLFVRVGLFGNRRRKTGIDSGPVPPGA